MRPECRRAGCAHLARMGLAAVPNVAGHEAHDSLEELSHLFLLAMLQYLGRVQIGIRVW